MKTLTFKKTKAQIKRNKRMKKDIAKLKKSAARISALVKMMRNERKKQTV